MKALAISALILNGCSSVPPTFETYSVPLTRIDTIAQTKIPQSGLDWKMEGSLQTSSQLGLPDFADRFTLFHVSCGTGCTEYALLDRVSGAFHPGGMVTFDYPSDYHGPYGLQYRRDSRLLLVYQAEGFAWPVYASYYVWDGAQMKLVKKEKMQPNKSVQTTPGTVSPAATGPEARRP
jgi:hypothetical protein